MEIGDYVAIRNLNTLINLAKTPQGKQNMRIILNRYTEPEGFIMAAVTKISARKWQLNEIITEENSFYLADDSINFTADWYNIKELNVAKPCEYYNELFGKQEEMRVLSEMNI